MAAIVFIVAAFPNSFPQVLLDAEYSIAG